MRQRFAERAAFLVLAILFGFGVAIAADPAVPRIQPQSNDDNALRRPQPQFPREAAGRAIPPGAPRSQSAVPSPPAGLVPTLKAENRRASVPSTVPAVEDFEATDDAAQTRPRPRPKPIPSPDPPDVEIEQHGLSAGAAIADALAAGEGRREAYRVGLWEGQRSSLADPRLGRDEFQDGARSGRWDRNAREFGAQEGARAAADAASREAPRQVERQFLDLDWDPVPSPLPARISYVPDFEPTPVPDIDSVFAAYPPGRSPHRTSETFENATWSPKRYRDCGDWHELTELTWRDPDRAFDVFRSDVRHSAFFRSLRLPRSRQLFEAAFVDGFIDRLPTTAGTLERAFGAGFRDGFNYGAFVRSEWSFRRGYAEGFDEGIALAAQVSFDRLYPGEYGRVYDDAFQEWIGSARPAILSARLSDGNDDGIFEPGEGFVVRAELANYGGAPATLPLALEGRALAEPSEAAVALSPRARSERELRALLETAVEAPSAETLVLSVGATRSSIPLLVSFPMEFSGVVAYDSRPLEQRARVRFEVRNTSRKSVETVEVFLDGAGSLGADRRPLGTVAPGQSREAEFSFDDVRPLDLIAGTLEVPVALAVDGRIQDRRSARFPERATRLDDPALVEVMVALGRETDPDLDEVDRARRLLMQRLRADWNARGAEEGNGYQADASSGASYTALGELVRAYEADRTVLSRSVAFHGLDTEIVALADQLPGVHPNLRRWMKRLATRLDG